MMNIYHERDSNVRKTYILFTAFLLVVIGAGWFFGQAYGDPSIVVFAALFAVAMSFGSYWWSDKLVLAMANARRVERADAPELYRVVENLAITAGLPMPRVFVVDEQAPNAFATGRDPKHAVVAVTTGLLERLDKVELEGVIAHELSHIGNRDMFLATAVVTLVGFISVLADFFIRSNLLGLRSRDREGGGGQFAAIIMLIGLALSILAPIIARLMHLAISRKREFLADASGALLTRYPEGLARALEKISRDPTPLRAAKHTTAHLWFDDPFDKPGQKMSWLAKLFLTHPPVEERIAALRGLKVRS